MRHLLSVFPFVPLMLVVSAPLVTYFGPAIQNVFSIVGLLLLIGYTVMTGAVRQALESPLNSREFAIGGTLTLITLLLWGYSSYMGINPRWDDNWGRIVLIVSLLTVFGVCAHRLPLRDHVKVFEVLAWLSLLTSAFVIVELFYAPLSGWLRNDLRASRLNFAGVIMIWGLPFTLYQWRKNPKRIWMPLVTLLAIGACNGRISWLVAPVVVGLYMAATWRTIGLGHWAVMWVAGALTFWIGTMGIVVTQGMAFLEKRMDDLASGSGEGRNKIWAFALEQWMAAPWFGIGVQGFRYLDFSHVTLKSMYHPHNSIVQLLLETGIIGTLAGTVTLAYLLHRAWNGMRESPNERIAIILCFVGLGGISLASTSLFHGWWMAFMLTPLAWMLAWPAKK